MILYQLNWEMISLYKRVLLILLCLTLLMLCSCGQKEDVKLFDRDAGKQGQSIEATSTIPSNPHVQPAETNKSAQSNSMTTNANSQLTISPESVDAYVDCFSFLINDEYEGYDRDSQTMYNWPFLLTEYTDAQTAIETLTSDFRNYCTGESTIISLDDSNISMYFNSYQSILDNIFDYIVQVVDDPLSLFEDSLSTPEKDKYSLSLELLINSGYYPSYDISELIDDLNSNSLSANKKYLNQRIAVRGRLSTIDSSGKYFSIDDNSFSLYNLTCDLQNEYQLEKLMDFNKGDELIVLGDITMVGEILSYQMDLIDMYKAD